MTIYDIILGCVGLCIALASIGMFTLGITGVFIPMSLAIVAIAAGLFVYSPVEKEDLPAIN